MYCFEVSLVALCHMISTRAKEAISKVSWIVDMTYFSKVYLTSWWGDSGAALRLVNLQTGIS